MIYESAKIRSNICLHVLHSHTSEKGLSPNITYPPAMPENKANTHTNGMIKWRRTGHPKRLHQWRDAFFFFPGGFDGLDAFVSIAINTTFLH